MFQYLKFELIIYLILKLNKFNFFIIGVLMSFINTDNIKEDLFL